MQGLKLELEASLSRVEAIEQDRKRLQKRNAETLKEKNQLESSDAALLLELGDRVSHLDAENAKLRRQTRVQDRDFKELMEVNEKKRRSKDFCNECDKF